MTIKCYTLLFCEWNHADIKLQSSISTSTLAHFFTGSPTPFFVFFHIFIYFVTSSFLSIINICYFNYTAYLHCYYYMVCIGNTIFWIPYELEVYQDSLLKDIAFFGCNFNRILPIFSDFSWSPTFFSVFKMEFVSNHCVIKTPSKLQLRLIIMFPSI